MLEKLIILNNYNTNTYSIFCCIMPLYYLLSKSCNVKVTIFHMSIPYLRTSRVNGLSLHFARVWYSYVIPGLRNSYSNYLSYLYNVLVTIINHAYEDATFFLKSMFFFLILAIQDNTKYIDVFFSLKVYTLKPVKLKFDALIYWIKFTPPPSRTKNPYFLHTLTM